MRYIKTTNSSVEFIEKDNNGVIVNARAFQFGSIYFLIKNGKVTFYSADAETPYRSDLWTVDIPVTINDVEYSDVEAVSAALGAVMNSDFADRLDEVEEGLATEEGRAQAAEEALDSKIDSETARSISAETTLQNAITAENTRAMTAEGVIAADLATETARAKGEEHRLDDRISGFETSLTNEIVRAHLAEAALSGAVDTEVSRAQAEEARIEAKMDAFEDMVTAEANRAKAAESAITDNLNAEISRAQNAEQTISGAVDAEISRAQAAESALTNAINSEVTRAQNAESAISDSLAAEVTRAQSAETANANAISAEVTRATNAEDALDDKIDAEIARAQAAESANTNAINAEVTRATTAEQGISGAVDVAVANLNSVKADKANAVASAVYDSSAKTINMFDISGNVLSSIDATDFIKDGMVSNVEVSNGKLVITFNTDAGKEAIEIPLTQIFDPANYYDKSAVDGLLSGKTDTAVTATLSGDVLTISGDVAAHTSNTDIHVTVADKTSWADKYTQAQVDAKVSALSGAIDTVSGDVISEASARGVADEALGSKIDNLSGAVDTEVSARQQAINAVSGAVDAVNATVTAHTANTDIHVTAQDKSTWSAKQNALVAGENITISGNVISAAGGEVIVDDHFDSASTNPVENRVVTDAVIAPAKDYWISNGTSQSVSRDYLDGIVLKYKVILYADDVPIGATVPDNFSINIAIADSPYGGSVWPAIQVTSFSAKTAVVDNDNVHLEWDEDGLIISVINPWSITRINCYTTGYRILSNSFSYSGGTIVDEAEKIIDEIGNVKKFADKAVKDVYLYGNGSDVVLAVSKFNGDSTQNNFSLFLGNGLTCENNKIVTDLNVPLGYSGWTSVEIPMGSNRVSIPKWHNEVRLTIKDWSAQDNTSFAIGIGNTGNSMTTHVTLIGDYVEYTTDYFTSVTFENEVLTMVLGEVWGQVMYITYVENFDLNNKVSAVEYYGEVLEPIVDYVQDLNSGLTTVSGDVANKQDLLVSGTNIKTINGTSLLGSGNIEIGGGTVDAYTKAETDALLSGKTDTATTSALNTVVTGHTGDSTIHVTSADKTAWNAKLDASALNGYATTATTDALSGAINGKQDVLVSGTNIKTINGNSVLGDGNIVIEGGGSSINVVQTTGTSSADVMSQDAVTVSLGDKAAASALTAHTANTTVHVTTSEKQTWNNKSNFSGSYNDLTNKPTIPTIWTGTQAQFDAITIKDSNTIYLVS